VRSADEKRAVVGATVLRQDIEVRLGSEYRDVQMIIYGPFESPVYKVEEKYRMRLVIKCRLNRQSRELFSKLLVSFGRNSKGKTALSIDFNPTGL
jgi:primosomal protein N'